MDRNGAEKRSPPGQVLVVGGGLAGLSAACELADNGHRVELLERRPYLGGRTYSFRDKVIGADVDNGQHVFMKCCTYYIDFLKRLGVYEKTHVQKRLSVRVIGRGGRTSFLSGSPFPSPFYLLPSFLRYSHLSWKDKLGIAYAAVVLKATSRQRRQRLDNVTFYDWLKAHRQSDRAIDNFWNLIILPTLNDAARDVSASQAIMVFQEGFLKDTHAADMGYPMVGLSALLAEEARQYLEARNGSVHLGQSLARLEGTEEGIEGAKTHGGTYRADSYILAVPPNKLLELLPPALRRHQFFAKAGRLRMSPIVNMHLWLDRKVTDSSFSAFLDSDLQWVFNKSAIYDVDGAPGQYLCISLSGAHKYIDMPKEELYNMLLQELHRRVPASREASVAHHTIVRERYATFAAVPGSAANRLPWRTPVPNLFLAGAWTDTGWPSTMESAVRSGIFCAREIMKEP